MAERRKNRHRSQVSAIRKCHGKGKRNFINEKNSFLSFEDRIIIKRRICRSNKLYISVRKRESKKLKERDVFPFIRVIHLPINLWISCWKKYLASSRDYFTVYIFYSLSFIPVGIFKKILSKVNQFLIHSEKENVRIKGRRELQRRPQGYGVTQFRAYEIRFKVWFGSVSIGSPRHMSECRCFVNGSGGTRARTRTFLTLFSAAVLNAALPLKITLTHALSVRSYAFIEAEENLFRVQDFNILDSCISKGIL